MKKHDRKPSKPYDGPPDMDFLIQETTAGVLRATESGTSWDSIGLMQDSVLALAIDSTGRVFAGTRKGEVFTMHDTGADIAIPLLDNPLRDPHILLLSTSQEAIP